MISKMVHAIKSHFINFLSKTRIFAHLQRKYQLALASENSISSKSTPSQEQTLPNKVIRSHLDTQTVFAPKHPPSNGYNPTQITHNHFEKPDGVHLKCFREIKSNEVLGNNASKMNEYKNPEYFSYHRYSWVDLFVNGQELRQKNVEQVEKCEGLTGSSSSDGNQQQNEDIRRPPKFLEEIKKENEQKGDEKRK